MLFHPDYVYGLTQQRVLSIFKVNSDGNDDYLEADGRDQYISMVKKVKLFSLAVKLIALRDSFRCFSIHLQIVRE